MQASDWINLAIAVFTAVAAVAALISARASRQAVEQANKAADESRKITEEQTKALMTAAKANALASRINFYERQILEAKEWLMSRGTNDTYHAEKLIYRDRLEREQAHLVRWLDEQTNALGVGLNDKYPDRRLH